MKSKIIIGIDPGTNIFGYGIIKKISNGECQNLENGVIKLKEFKDHILKLKNIYEILNRVINRHLPDELAIEAPFLGVNVQSMLKLGKVQGLVMAIAISKEIPIVEYAPKKIKISVTGNASASKGEVQKFVKMHLNLQEINKYSDASDALAVAICHSMQKNSKTKKNESWKEYLKENPNRVV